MELMHLHYVTSLSKIILAKPQSTLYFSVKLSGSSELIMENFDQINEINQTGIAVFSDDNQFSVSIINILLLVIILLLGFPS